MNSRTASRFEKFHADNPGVYTRMVQEAREWKASGGNLLGVAMLMERIRWAGQVERWDAGFKLTADYAAYYARLIMAQEPDLDGIFRTKVSDADAWLTDYIARKVTVTI